MGTEYGERIVQMGAAQWRLYSVYVFRLLSDASNVLSTQKSHDMDGMAESMEKSIPEGRGSMWDRSLVLSGN